MKKKNKEKLLAGVMAALNGTTMLCPMAAFTAAVALNYDAGVAEAGDTVILKAAAGYSEFTGYFNVEGLCWPRRSIAC